MLRIISRAIWQKTSLAFTRDFQGVQKEGTGAKKRSQFGMCFEVIKEQKGEKFRPLVSWKIHLPHGLKNKKTKKHRLVRGGSLSLGNRTLNGVDRKRTFCRVSFKPKGTPFFLCFFAY